MAFDSLVLAAVVSELSSQLKGARINKIYQPEPASLLLRYHNEQGRGNLYISAHPQSGRLHLTENAPENPAKAPLFAMVLRKWLEGARITGIDCVAGERVAILRFSAHDDLGDARPISLVTEIMGKHSNIILVDDGGRIIDGARRYGGSLSRYREVLPGKPYIPPPPQNKLDLPPGPEDLARLFYAQPDKTISHSLQQGVNGLSPLLAREATLAAGLEPERNGGEMGVGELDKLLLSLARLSRRVREGDYAPTIRRENGRYTDFAAICPLEWEETLSCSSMNQAVDLFYTVRNLELRTENRRRLLMKQISHHSNRLLKKIALQEEELAKSEAAEAYKEAGDLLAANLFHIEKGASQVELADFTDPERLVLVKLDPARSPQENARNYYRRYGKAKKARSLIAGQLHANYDEAAYLQSLEQSLRDSDSLAGLEEINKEAVAAGYVKSEAPGRGKKSEANAPLPPREYKSVDGFIVLIGRNNRQNDRLSLKTAAADDIWLHTQKIPGSHVIIISRGQEIPESTLYQAASWAAWFSKAQDSSQVPVDITPVANLRKPAGSRPGFVTYSNQRTIYVTPARPPARP